MRLHILSDLHLEFESFTPPEVAADAVILAGDVSTGRNGLKWALKSFPERPVIYVLGNHEFYGQKVQKLIKEFQEMAQDTNVHLLENQSCTIGDVLFLGATLWTDFALNGDPVMSEVVAQTSTNDYRRIRTLLRYSRLKPSVIPLAKHAAVGAVRYDLRPHRKRRAVQGLTGYLLCNTK